MQPGDLVFIMGDPGRPVLGTHPVDGYNRAEMIRHGTPAVMLDIQEDTAARRTHIKVLVRGMQLWVPSSFVKATNAEV